MKYGILENSLKQSWEKMFSTARELGFDGVELSVREDYTGSRLWSHDGQEFIETSVDESEVEVCSLCLDLLNNKKFSPASLDATERKRGIEVINESIEVCKIVGGKVVLVPFFGSSTISSQEAKEYLISSLEECAETAEVEDIYLALESTLSSEETLKIIEGVDSSYVKVYFDVGNAVELGFDPAVEIEALGEEIIQVHIKDTGEKAGDQPLGEGRVDLKAALGALGVIDYDGYLVLETPSIPDPLEAAKTNLQYLKSQI